MNSKIRILITALCSVLFFAQCNFLDIVPDNTVEVGSLFENRESALTALSTAYRYMPNFEKLHSSMSLAGDEWLGRLDASQAADRSSQRGIKLMSGWNTPGDPILNFWAEGGGANGLYRGIRICNIFLEHIDGVPGLIPQEIADWSAQARFLKAYYHYWMIRLYGPIVIMDENLEPSASVEEVRKERQTIDTSFDYVLGVINEIINSEVFPPVRSVSFLGQIDQQIAKAVRAEILLARASPLFNGNIEYYSNFRGINGEPLFPQEYSAQKWKDALDAIEEAILFSESNGRQLYRFEGFPKFWDVDDFQHSEIIQYAYNNRFSIVENWNDELIWGYSGLDFTGDGGFAHGSNMRTATEPTTASYAWQWLGATYRMTERFYSRNGLPIEDDITFDFDNRFEHTNAPSDTYHRGYLQPNYPTIRLHLNREPRFYAWLAVDGGLWRTHDLKNNVGMRFNQFDNSNRTQLGGRSQAHTTDFYWTGVAVKKMVHPESGTGHWARVVKYPYPIIRLADLYLMYAEAYNEYHGPGQPAFDKLNVVRARAGLNPVERVWSDATIASPRVLNSHLTQAGLREIIHRERAIELSFEGKRYFDVLRWKKADRYFTTPVRGWNTSGPDPAQFYILMTLQPRVWQTPRDYLMPLPLDELNRNPNLVQNPGW
jgi:hypothetical protein